MRAVRVFDIVLDIAHPAYDVISDIGTVYYDELDDLRKADKLNGCEDKECGGAGRAKPFHMNMMHFPLKNEIIHILDSVNKNYYQNSKSTDYYLPPVSVLSNITQNTLPNNVNEKGEYPIGNYYRENHLIKRLQPYEGDTIFQGRFGNSIRFGSTVNNRGILNRAHWSNTGSIGDPITIISNGQRDRKSNNKGYAVEDINNDKSSIWLCNNQQMAQFTVASSYKASYYYDQEMLTTESPQRPEEDMASNVSEDVQLSETTEEVIEENNDQVQDEESMYDIAETLNQIISTGDTFNLPASYKVPSGVDAVTFLNEQIG